jgi:hypothetical protein
MAAALQDRLRAALPDFTLMRDIIHVTEYLWDVANAVLGERHPERTAWVRGHLVALQSGRTDAVIAALEAAAVEPDLPTARQQAIQRTIGDYRRNVPYIRYDQYLAAGWPIGTGVVEGSCGHLVKDRIEQAGMRWTKAGAHAVLDLSAVRLSHDRDVSWAFHRQRQYQRQYGQTSAASAPSEVRGWPCMSPLGRRARQATDFGRTSMSSAVQRAARRLKLRGSISVGTERMGTACADCLS